MSMVFENNTTLFLMGVFERARRYRKDEIYIYR